MAEAFADPDRIEGYHAHIYYDPATTRAKAERVRQGVGERFETRLGNWHDEPVGPHPVSMYQIAFADRRISAAGAVADAEPRRARRAGSPALRRQPSRPHAICDVARPSSAIAARRASPELPHRLTPAALYAADQQQHNDDDEEDPDAAARVIPPAAAVAPCRQCADQQQDQDYQKDSAQHFIPHVFVDHRI